MFKIVKRRNTEVDVDLSKKILFLGIVYALLAFLALQYYGHKKNLLQLNTNLAISVIQFSPFINDTSLKFADISVETPIIKLNFKPFKRLKVLTEDGLTSFRTLERFSIDEETVTLFFEEGLELGISSNGETSDFRLHIPASRVPITSIFLPYTTNASYKLETTNTDSVIFIQKDNPKNRFVFQASGIKPIFSKNYWIIKERQGNYTTSIRSASPSYNDLFVKNKEFSSLKNIESWLPKVELVNDNLQNRLLRLSVNEWDDKRALFYYTLITEKKLAFSSWVERISEAPLQFESAPLFGSLKVRNKNYKNALEIVERKWSGEGITNSVGNYTIQELELLYRWKLSNSLDQFITPYYKKDFSTKASSNAVELWLDAVQKVDYTSESKSKIFMWFDYYLENLEIFEDGSSYIRGKELDFQFKYLYLLTRLSSLDEENRYETVRNSLLKSFLFADSQGFSGMKTGNFADLLWSDSNNLRRWQEIQHILWQGPEWATRFVPISDNGGIAYTTINDFSATVSGRNISLNASFPVGAVQYIVISEISRPENLNLFNITWPEDSGFELYHSGWFYDERTMSLFIKITHREEVENISLTLRKEG